MLVTLAFDTTMDTVLIAPEIYVDQPNQTKPPDWLTDWLWRLKGQPNRSIQFVPHTATSKNFSRNFCPTIIIIISWSYPSQVVRSNGCNIYFPNGLPNQKGQVEGKPVQWMANGIAYGKGGIFSSTFHHSLTRAGCLNSLVGRIEIHQFSQRERDGN